MLFETLLVAMGPIPKLSCCSRVLMQLSQVIQKQKTEAQHQCMPAWTGDSAAASAASSAGKQASSAAAAASSSGGGSASAVSAAGK